MSAELLSYDYLSSVIKPYVSDLSLALVFGAGYYLFKLIQNKNNNEPLSKEIKTSIRQKLDKWENAKTLNIYNGLIIQNCDKRIDAFNILTKMQKAGITPDIITYNCLIDMSFRNHQSENGIRLFEEICDSFSGLQPDIVTFNIIIKHYVGEIKDHSNNKYTTTSANEKFSKINKVIKEIKTRDIKFNEITYNTIIDAYVELGDFENTWTLFMEMKENNLIPDSYTYATLIKGLKICGLNDGVEKALSILELIKSGACQDIKPDEVLYNSVLDICIKNSKIELAEKIFNEMKSKKIIPSIITYSIMIRGYGIIYNIKKAFEVYEEMIASGMQPNEIIYGCLMNCAVRCSNTELMHEIYEKMKKLNIKPNQIIYTTLIKGYNKMQMYEKAFKIFDEVPDAEKDESNIVMYNAILDVCVESRNFEKLKTTYDYIKNRALSDENFPRPNLITFSTVIKGYIKSKNIEEVLKIYDFLKENNFKFDEIFFSILLEGLSSFDLVEKAEEIFNEMNTFNVKRTITYSNMIKMYSKIYSNDGHEIKKALDLFTQMRKENIKPSIITYTTLIQMFIKRKKISEAIKIFREISLEGLEIDYVCYNFIINGCTFNKNLEHAITFLLESLDKNIILSKETYKNVLEYLLNNKFMKFSERRNMCSKILTEIKKREITIDYDLYSRLMRLIYDNNNNKNNGQGDIKEKEANKYNFNSNSNSNNNHTSNSNGNNNFNFNENKKKFVRKNFDNNDNNNKFINKQFNSYKSLYDS
jgi:pentatricopeptide repeat protein